MTVLQCQILGDGKVGRGEVLRVRDKMQTGSLEGSQSYLEARQRVAVHAGREPSVQTFCPYATSNASSVTGAGILGKRLLEC